MFCCGCNTFRTTAIDRCEHDTLVVNPDKPMKGIPVSLKVPTHLELKVIETTYWEKQDIPGSKPTLVPLRTCRPTRSLEHELCYTEKIFLVDPAKPVAGEQKYGFTFKSNASSDADDMGKGYLNKVTYKIDDKTITETANLVANSLKLLNAFPISANGARPNTSDLISTDRTIAYLRLDINSPTFEQEVTEFLDCNLNNTTSASTDCPRVCTQPHCVQ